MALATARSLSGVVDEKVSLEHHLVTPEFRCRIRSTDTYKAFSSARTIPSAFTRIVQRFSQTSFELLQLQSSCEYIPPISKIVDLIGFVPSGE